MNNAELIWLLLAVNVALIVALMVAVTAAADKGWITPDDAAEIIGA